MPCFALPCVCYSSPSNKTGSGHGWDCSGCVSVPSRNSPPASSTDVLANPDFSHEDIVKGRLITFPASIWHAKLREADWIEGIADIPAGSTTTSSGEDGYHRDVVQVEKEGGEVVSAYAYLFGAHPKEGREEHRIATGDWLDRYKKTK